MNVAHGRTQLCFSYDCVFAQSGLSSSCLLTCPCSAVKLPTAQHLHTTSAHRHGHEEFEVFLS